MELAVFVPAPGSWLEKHLLPGSAIVGSDVGPLVLVHWEGNKYGAENMQTYEEKAYHAASRHVHDYPTVARAWVEPGQLVEVGAYDYRNKTLDVHDQDSLDAWRDRAHA